MIRLEIAGEARRGGHLGRRDGAVARQVDRHRHQRVAALKAQHRLPAVVDGDRLRGAVDAGAHALERVEHAAPALPGGHVQPSRVVRGAARGSPGWWRHLAPALRLRARRAGSRWRWRGPSVLSGSPQPTTASSTSARRERGEALGAQRRERPRPHQRGADEAAHRTAGHGGEQAGHGGLGQQRRRPRDRHPDVRPAPLGRQADRADRHARRARPRPPAAGAVARRNTSSTSSRLDDVEREVRRGLAEHDAHDQREEAADHEEAGHRRAARRRARGRCARSPGRCPRRASRASGAGPGGTGARRSRTRPGRWRAPPGSRPPGTRAGCGGSAATRWRLVRGRSRPAPRWCSAIAPSVASEPPPMSIRWVGPQSVTSWPKRRCQRSSSGKAGEGEGAAGGDHQPAGGRPPAVAQVHGRVARALARAAPCVSAPASSVP